jgi:hypothetical protein
MSRTKILIQGSLIRAGYGVAALAFPKYLTAAVGVQDFGDNARYMNRLLGGRDIVLAGSTVLAARRGDGAAAARANILAETADTAALLGEYQDRGKLDKVLLIGLAFNVVGHLTWTRALLARAPKAVEAAAEALTPESGEPDSKRRRRKRSRD